MLEVNVVVCFSQCKAFFHKLLVNGVYRVGIHCASEVRAGRASRMKSGSVQIHNGGDTCSWPFMTLKNKTFSSYFAEPNN